MASSPALSSGGGPTRGDRLRTLRGLAAYRCGHSGACCDAGWPIPVEPAPLALLRSAARAGSLPHTSAPPLAGDVLGRTPEGACAFHGRGVNLGCRLERALGPDALPTSCRQFPRILLLDDRGWHQSLSAWCVTTARLIVNGLDDFLSFDHIECDPRVHVEALDARHAWPPLLRPGVLAGFAEFSAFEARVLDAHARAEHTGACANLLHQLLAWVDDIRAWRPGTDLIRSITDTPFGASVPPAARHERSNLAYDLILSVPEPWQPRRWPRGLAAADLGGPTLTRRQAEDALVRYSATRLIGSWLAYQGAGFRSVVASLVSSYVLASEALARNGDGPPTFGRMTAALRAADWLQLHLLDREVWAAWCSQWESDPDAAALHSLVAAATAQLDALAWAPSSTAEV